jgi:MFS family permease
MVIAGVVVVAFGFCLLPLAELFAGTWRTIWLLGTTLLTQLGYALYLVNGLPFTMEATGDEERNHVFSVHMALGPLAAFIGSLLAGALPGVLAPLLGTSLENPAPYRWPLVLAGLLLIPGVPVLLHTSRTGNRQPQAPAVGAPLGHTHRAPYGLFLVFGLIVIFRFAGRGPLSTFFNVYMDEGLGVSTAVIGALAAIGQLLSVPAALTAPLLVARRGHPWTIAWGSLAMALCMVPLALIPQGAAAGVSFVSSSAIFSMTAGPIRLLSQELVAPRWRATMASVFMMGAGLAYSSVSLAGGYIIVALGYRTLFWLGAGLTAMEAIAFWYWFRVPRGEMPRQPQLKAAK